MSMSPEQESRARVARQAAATRNMTALDHECRMAGQTARRFRKRGALAGVRQNSGQAEVRSLIAIERNLERALSLTRSTRALVAAERGVEW